MERCTYYKVWMLKTKRRSTSKMLTKETFCRVCLYLAKKMSSATLSAIKLELAWD
jgi:hypothetical protein